MTSATNPSIRPATPADAAALAGLRYAFRAAIDPPAEPEPAFVARCTRWMAERLAGSAWRCWVAEQRATIVGTVWLGLFEKIPNPVAEPELHGYLSNLYVRPEHRGRGTGGALLAAAMQECDDRRLDAVILWPTPESRSLYERHGFAVRDDLMERRRPKPAA
jgi:GNAT superfamily N-acetyltransferase